MSETSTETEATEAPTRVESIGSAFRQRAEAVAAGAQREREREEAEKKAAAKRRAAAQEEPVEGDEVEGGEAEAKLPTTDWKKDEILDWLVDNEVITEEQRSEVEGQTKAELIDNFVDAEG